jgi:hypothetical protein
MDEREEEFSEHILDYLIAETRNSYYGIISKILTEPIWIPKNAVGSDFRIKAWYIRKLKEEKTPNKLSKTKMKQVKLTNFVTMF